MATLQQFESHSVEWKTLCTT